MPLLLPLKRKTKKMLFVSSHRADVYRIKSGIAKGKTLRITKRIPERELGNARPSEVRMYYYSKIANSVFPKNKEIGFIDMLGATESKPAKGRQGQIISATIKANKNSIKGTEGFYSETVQGSANYDKYARKILKKAMQIKERIFDETGIKLNFHPVNVLTEKAGRMIFIDILSIDRKKLEDYLTRTRHPEKEKILMYLDRAEKRMANIPDND